MWYNLKLRLQPDRESEAEAKHAAVGRRGCKERKRNQRAGRVARGNEEIMELTDIKELYRNRGEYIGKEVTIGGWVRSNRDSKNFGFLIINDGTFFEPL